MVRSLSARLASRIALVASTFSRACSIASTTVATFSAMPRHASACCVSRFDAASSRFAPALSLLSRSKTRARFRAELDSSARWFTRACSAASVVTADASDTVASSSAQWSSRSHSQAAAPVVDGSSTSLRRIKPRASISRVATSTGVTHSCRILSSLVGSRAAASSAACITAATASVASFMVIVCLPFQVCRQSSSQASRRSTSTMHQVSLGIVAPTRSSHSSRTDPAMVGTPTMRSVSH
mmetsp:Transcript_650/g.2029  ORF Transcript_650/g.2029 Transcript_650/m.2029 type:complete len:240 (+) Transcript_650:937-1656(+)